jgi:hypothetical protein
MEIISSFQE